MELISITNGSSSISHHFEVWTQFVKLFMDIFRTEIRRPYEKIYGCAGGGK